MASLPTSPIIYDIIPANTSGFLLFIATITLVISCVSIYYQRQTSVRPAPVIQTPIRILSEREQYMEKVTEAFDWLMRVRDVSAPAFLEHIDSAQERVRQSSEINNQLNDCIMRVSHAEIMFKRDRNMREAIVAFVEADESVANLKIYLIIERDALRNPQV